ncbi:helix-turn-helix domain-containing protein [Candidatus Alkanophaga liquidiphilum]
MRRRTNTFKLKPTKEQERRLFELADNCPDYGMKLIISGGGVLQWRNKIDWNTDEEYGRYKRLVGSATAQQIIRKNNEAWKSFFALLKQKKEGKLPPHINRIKPPGYWKTAGEGRRC